MQEEVINYISKNHLCPLIKIILTCEIEKFWLYGKYKNIEYLETDEKHPNVIIVNSINVGKGNQYEMHSLYVYSVYDNDGYGSRHMHNDVKILRRKIFEYDDYIKEFVKYMFDIGVEIIADSIDSETEFGTRIKVNDVEITKTDYIWLYDYKKYILLNQSIKCINRDIVKRICQEAMDHSKKNPPEESLSVLNSDDEGMGLFL